eukprot:5064281-Heterocapsa_arctica.AAC.1
MLIEALLQGKFDLVPKHGLLSTDGSTDSASFQRLLVLVGNPIQRSSRPAVRQVRRSAEDTQKATSRSAPGSLETRVRKLA